MNYADLSGVTYDDKTVCSEEFNFSGISSSEKQPD